MDNKEFIECFDNEKSILNFSLGALCVEWLRDSDLLDFDYFRIDETNPQYIKPSNTILNLIKDKTQIPLNVPDRLPMIV